MERPAFQKLTEFMAGLEARKLQLWGREQEIIKALTAKETSLDEAIITGTHQAVQESIDTLKTELANVQRERYAVTNPPRDGILGELTKAAWKEAVDEIQGPLREAWDKELAELEKGKALFMAAVGELGAIRRRADTVSGRISEVLLSMPGPKLVVPTLATGIISRPDRHEGPIFINPLEIEKTFKGGK